MARVGEKSTGSHNLGEVTRRSCPDSIRALGRMEGKKAVENTYDPKDKHRASRVVESGLDLLDNNEVNFLMAFIMSTGAMAVAGWLWDMPLDTILGA